MNVGHSSFENHNNNNTSLLMMKKVNNLLTAFLLIDLLSENFHALNNRVIVCILIYSAEYIETIECAWYFKGGSAFTSAWNGRATKKKAFISMPRGQTSYNIELDVYSRSGCSSRFEARTAPGYSDDHHHQAPLTRPISMNKRFFFTPYI